MDWHARYQQQAGWTRHLRAYLCERAGLRTARRALEVGCGTGAILAPLQTSAAVHGLDLEPAALTECRVHAPSVFLTRADAHALPYAARTFDLTFCHFLLLWVSDPLQALREMKRVTRRGGHVLALAEPDYRARVDQPEELAVLGRLQRESLRRQGADPDLGGRLAALFAEAGIEIIETGALAAAESAPPTPGERELEWAALEADLAGSLPEEEVRRLKALDERAWARGERLLHVPTYFAWGLV